MAKTAIQAQYLHEVGVLGVTDRDHSMHLLDELLLLVIIKLHVPLGQPGLACTVLDQNEADLQKGVGEAGEEEE